MKKQSSLAVYFSGGTTGFAHLLGHAGLAEAVYEKSHGRYLCRLPQDFAPRASHSRFARDQRLRALLGCDAGLFCLDGAAPDGVTAAEFMFAKFADLPAVVLRDTAAGGSRVPLGQPTDFCPRTVTLSLDSLRAYRALQTGRRPRRAPDEITRLAGQHASATAAHLCDQVAVGVVRALDKAVALDPVMPRYLREEVYIWLALMLGLRGKARDLRKEFEHHLERKVKRGLL